MKVVFRADASIQIGSGHVMRCVTLAKALRERGAEVSFVCREADGDMTGWLSAQGLDVVRLLGNPGDDAEEALGKLARPDVSGADWIVVDHYGLDHVWEQAARHAGYRVLAIDDLADRRHDCDLLLDQNLVRDYDLRYASLVDDTVVQLVGPRYAMLQNGYRSAHGSVELRRGRPGRILVYFGASDLPDMTGRVVESLLRRASDDVAVDMVVGALNPNRDRLLAMADADPRVTAHLQMPSLIDLMSKADLAIGAGGATSWERLCLGLPSLVVTLADNQRPIAAELHDRNLAVWLGDAVDLDEYKLDDAIGDLLCRGLESWFDATGASAIDGRGVDRVVAAMMGGNASELVCRPWTVSDEWLLLDWANDPATRASAFQPQRISPEGHHAWLARRLGDQGLFRLFMIETANGVEVGQVRFERSEDAWIISYSLAREFRGLGLGSAVLQLALDALQQAVGSTVVAGFVRPENTASRRVFDRLHFTAARVDDKAIEFRRHL